MYDSNPLFQQQGFFARIQDPVDGSNNYQGDQDPTVYQWVEVFQRQKIDPVTGRPINGEREWIKPDGGRSSGWVNDPNHTGKHFITNGAQEYSGSQTVQSGDIVWLMPVGLDIPMFNDSSEIISDTGGYMFAQTAASIMPFRLYNDDLTGSAVCQAYPLVWNASTGIYDIPKQNDGTPDRTQLIYVKTPAGLASPAMSGATGWCLRQVFQFSSKSVHPIVSLNTVSVLYGTLAANLASTDAAQVTVLVPGDLFTSRAALSVANPFGDSGDSGAPCMVACSYQTVGGVSNSLVWTLLRVKPGGTVWVVTNVDFDNSAGTLRKRTRQITTAVAGEESAWTIYATGSSAASDLQRDDTTITVDISAVTSVWSETVTLSAVVSHAVGVNDPTGFVYWFADGVDLGIGATIDSGGNASATCATIPVGTANISAKYMGDSNYNPSTSGNHAVTVNKAGTDCALALSVGSSTYGDSVTLTAQVTPTAPADAGLICLGSVSFYDGTTLLGSASAAGSTAPATFAIGLQTIMAGTRTLHAVYTASGTPGRYNNSTSGNQTLTVAKAHLTCTASDCTKTYGSANPGFNYTLTGFVLSQTATATVTGSPTFTTPATASSNVASYAVTPAAGTLAAANYDFPEMVAGTLTVTTAVLVITAHSASGYTSNPPPALTGTISGLIGTDGITATYTTSYTNGNPAGSYPIYVTPVDSGSKLANYQVTLVQSKLTITNNPGI